LTRADEQDRLRADYARRVALWRYQLIREAADPAHTTRQRGRLVREIADREHVGPHGQPVRVGRSTLDKWILRWRRGGFDALIPSARNTSPRTPAEVLDMAAALKRRTRPGLRRRWPGFCVSTWVGLRRRPRCCGICTGSN